MNNPKCFYPAIQPTGVNIFVISGVKGMIMTPTVCLENDNDARTLEFIMDEHIDDYGVPLSLAADRGFMSRHNIEYLKEIGVENPAIGLKSNISIDELGISEETYKNLMNKRSKVEAVISHMKRVFGLRRSTSKGDKSAEKYIIAGIMSYDFIKLANLVINNRKLN